MNSKVSLKSFFLNLSSLLDIGNSELIYHQIKTAFIAWRLGLELRLTDNQMNALLIASLIHDIGAISLEEKINLKHSVSDSDDTHAFKGWYILQQVPNFQDISEAVKYHHTSYKILKDNQILAQVINLSDKVEKLIVPSIPILEQIKHIINTIKLDEDLHPMLIDSFVKIGTIEKYWLDLSNKNILLFFEKAPIDSSELSEEMLVSLSFLIKDIIDFKSPFTVSHSLGVMYCSSYLAQKEGVSEDVIKEFSIAGLLHDVGKLTVPNSIIMKQGALTTRERAIMSQHSYYTYRFLKDAKYSKEICLAAACHHERLDGSGYPFKFESKKIGLLQRIMAVCDVFVALFEDRPYRKGLSLISIENIMNNLAPQKLDKHLINELLKNYHSLNIELREINDINNARYTEIHQVNY